MLLKFNNTLLNLNNIFQVKWHLYVTDFLDIFIIALLIYSLFVFFRRTKTITVFMGFAIAIGLYVFAEIFNLYLTLLALRYIAGISVIIFVIIFQNEIRKYFEFLGLLGTRQIKVGPLASRSPSTTEIIQSTVRMAQAKIGALIVIQGKDNIDPFIDGGIDLDGVISEEVLLSIFDPHSEGHDGALIISNNRIAKFSAHLPLSTNFKEIGKQGTRHSAALGLSENTDALCIVASEEKGKISVCKDGKLKTLDDFVELEKELDKYIKSKFNNKNKNSWNIIFNQNLVLKIGALGLAGIIWFFTAYKADIVEKTYKVPISFDNLPKDVLVENYNPKDITITVNARGNEIFSTISPTSFKVIINAENLQNGLNKEFVTKKSIITPANISLVSFEPVSFLLTAQKYYSAQLPVTPKIKGALPKTTLLTSTMVTPDKIEVWIPQGIKAPTELNTETIDISNLTDSAIIPVKVIIPSDIRLANGDTTANVALTIEKK
jgi:diadenylate cyclase